MLDGHFARDLEAAVNSSSQLSGVSFLPLRFRVAHPFDKFEGKL
jgi:hypothetical protein